MAAPPIAHPAAQAPTRPDLKRRLSLLERPWAWLVFGVGSSLVFLALLLLGASGLLGGREIRGYTVAGLLLGLVAAGSALASAAYSLRKRWLQERLPFGRGTMMMWLWAHVALGLVAVTAALLHAGYGAMSFAMSSGKLLLAAFAVLILTGLVWRLLYRFVPPVAAPRVGNYAQDDSLERAEHQLLEVEKLAAGRQAHFHALKDWMLANEDGHALRPEVEQAMAGITPEERTVLTEIRRLAASRRRALQRHMLQARYARILQGMRIVHIPLTILCAPLLFVHIVGALELPARILPLGTIPFESLSGVHSSSECKSCHRLIYDQWSSSMHANAMTSPVTIAQNNQLQKVELASRGSPDPQRLCVNCHGPLGTAIAKQASLPFESALANDELLNEGIGCAVCHQFTGSSKQGQAGLAAFQRDLSPGSKFVAQIEDPVGNAFHRSESSALFTKDPDSLCSNCHNVLYDANGDGKVEKGLDLVLQTTTDEYLEYRGRGGKLTCIGCHMPPVPGKNRVAETAAIPFEQDEAAPPRELHDHSFVGVDYPIDKVAQRDPQRERRQALLRGAAELRIDPAGTGLSGGQLTAKLTITNVGAGHNLPTGFAFARQMWLEVKALDAGGRVISASGSLANPSDDLCDTATIDDDGNPMKRFIQGCGASDPQLVSFQQKLVDRIDIARDKANSPIRNEKGELKPIQAAGAEESWLQHLAGGVVVRVRPSDKQPLTVLGPGESRSFLYRLPVGGRSGGVTLSVRLLFRSLPPYMLRALAANQPATEKPQLGPLVQNLQIVEMAAVKQAFN